MTCHCGYQGSQNTREAQKSNLAMESMPVSSRNHPPPLRSKGGGRGAWGGDKGGHAAWIWITSSCEILKSYDFYCICMILYVHMKL